MDNVQGARRELMKYWNSVSSNRWLIAKMFGVLMVSRFYLPSCCTTPDLLPSLGNDIWITTFVPLFRTCCIIIFAILILGWHPYVYFFSFPAFFRWITMQASHSSILAFSIDMSILLTLLILSCLLFSLFCGRFQSASPSVRVHILEIIKT